MKEDLKKITLEKMNEYIGSEETSFLRAWEVTLSKVNFELNPPVGELKSKDGAITVEPVKEETIKTNETKNAETKKSK